MNGVFANFKTGLSALRTHQLSGNRNELGMWVGPDAAVIAEFTRAPAASGPTLLWFDSFDFGQSDDFAAGLRALVRGRRLDRRSVSMALCTAHIFHSRRFDMSLPVEDQQVLPVPVAWENVDWAVSATPFPLIAAIRQSDADTWREMVRRAGLTLERLMPAGVLWSRIFEIPSDGAVLQTPGSTVMYHDGSAVSMPREQADCSAGVACGGVTMLAQSGANYTGFAAAALLALEPLLAATVAPALDVNVYAFEGARANRAQHVVWKVIRVGSIGCAAAAAAVALALGLLAAWYGVLGPQREEARAVGARVAAVRRDIARVAVQLDEYRHLLAHRSNVTAILNELPLVCDDSLWLSELEVSGRGVASVSLAGYALGERAIARILDSTGGVLAGLPRFQLQYSEQLSPSEVAKRTRRKRSVALRRFSMATAGGGRGGGRP